MRVFPLPFTNEADRYKLTLFPWQIIAALSFRGAKFSEGRQIARFKAAMRSVAEISGVPFEEIVWGLKLEWGRCGDRAHFHVVLTGLPPTKVKAACPLLKYWWTKKGGGREADVEIFDPKQNGLAYLAKRPGVRPDNATRSTAKFGVNGEDIFFSENFVRLAKLPG
jgi:hypothetical protein